MNETMQKKIFEDIKEAMITVMTKAEYDIRLILLGLNAFQSSYACFIFDAKTLEDQKEVARNLGQALETQIMTCYTGDPDYKVER